MTWPRLFSGWTRVPHAFTAVRVRLSCGCEATHYPSGTLWAQRWCPPHRADRNRWEQERFARMKPAPATAAEVAEFLEGIGAQREGERETDRAARPTTNPSGGRSRVGGARRGAATFPFVLLGLAVAFTAMWGISEAGHHVREFVTVMSQFGAACAAVGQ